MTELSDPRVPGGGAGKQVTLGGAETSSGKAAGLVIVDGLAKNAIRVSSGTYDSTTVLGFRILVKGSGTLTFTPYTSGATPVVITAAELTAMGVNVFQDWPMACSAITLGNADMELLVYI